MKLKTFLPLLAVALPVFLPGASEALPFSYSLNGTFNNPVGSNNMAVSGVGTNQISYGQTLDQSSITFTTSSINQSVLNFGQLFPLAYLAFDNTPIGPIEGAPTSISLDMAFNLPAPYNQTASLTRSYDIGIVTTPGADVDDTLMLPDFSSAAPIWFSWGDASTGIYGAQLRLETFSLVNTSAFTPIDNWSVPEGETDHIVLGAQFTQPVLMMAPAQPPTSTVPEPSTLVLLGTGLAGYAATGLRKRSKS